VHIATGAEVFSGAGDDDRFDVGGVLKAAKRSRSSA
jgi:hypothetical protein